MSSSNSSFDLIVIGAGTAGLPAAIFAAERGASILVLDAAPEIGGTLHLSSGQMSAAGTRLQKKKGIEDSPALHLNDIMRISKGTADPMLAGLAVSNAAHTMDWLEDIGFAPLPAHPVKGLFHEPYTVERYVWGERMGKSILAVLRAPFEAAVERGAVTLKLNTRVSSLVQSEDGTVTGVVARTDADTGSEPEETFSAKAVLIAAGGYVANRDMYRLYAGHPCYGDHSYPFNVGDALTLGLSAGGVTQGENGYLTSFGSIMRSYDVPSKVRCAQTHWPHIRMPWEIYVNGHGQRFMREDEPSVDVREHVIQEQPDLRHWIVFDATTLAEAPDLIPDFSADQIKAAAENDEPMFYVADSIAALAEKAGLPAEALMQTVSDYNAGQANGTDSLGRKDMPRHITDAPFYAIRAQATTVSSHVGLTVNEQLQVVRDDASPVPGLYAAGEALGRGAIMGSGISGGMLVTPALTFGRLFGQSLLPL